MKHIAYLLPHTDVTTENDVQRMLPGYIMHTQRMWLEDVSEAAERRMVEEALPDALRYLEGVTAYDCAVFGCTSASAVNGRAGMEEIEALISRRLGCPAISAFGALLRYIRKKQAKYIAVFTPYTDEVNTFFKRTMEDFGVSVLHIAGLGLVSDREIADCPPEKILEFAREQKGWLPAEAELCLFSCTNFRASELQRELEALLERPVISSNLAVMDFITSCVP